MFIANRAMVGGIVYQMKLPQDNRRAWGENHERYELSETRTSNATAKPRMTVPPFVLIVGLLAVTGCRPSAPAPTYNEDLGTDETVLLPTSSVWHDPAVARGQVDWRPFRKPGTEVKPVEAAAGEVKSTGANQGVESVLRGLVDDFNAAVAEGKFNEAGDFLIEEQIEPAKKIVELIPIFAGRLEEIAEVLPGDNEDLKRAVAEMSLSKALKLDLASITVASPSEAVGKPVGSSPGVGDVRFVLVKEDKDEYWYIDHPQIKAIAATLPVFQQGLPQLDAFIAGVKSGQIGGEALAQQGAMMNQMIGAMLSPDSEPAADPTKGEPEEDAKPEEKAKPEGEAEPEEEGGG